MSLMVYQYMLQKVHHRTLLQQRRQSFQSKEISINVQIIEFNIKAFLTKMLAFNDYSHSIGG